MGSLSSQQASCVMAAPSPHRFFAAWRVEAFFLFLLRWVLHLAAFVIRGLTLHGSSSFLSEESLDECGRPCDPLSCLLFSALWLRCGPTVLVQETPSVDPTCSTTSLFGDATCLPVGPVSLDWLVNPCGRSDPSGPSLPPGALSGAQQRGAFPAVGHSRWRQGALHAQPSYNVLQGGMDVAPSSPKACDVLLGTPGSSLDLFSKDKRNRESKLNYLKNLWTTTTSFVSRKCMERTSFFKLSRYWLLDFDYLVLFSLTMNMREDRPSAFIGIFYPKRLL